MKYAILSKSGVVLKFYNYKVKSNNVVEVTEEQYQEINNLPVYYRAIYKDGSFSFYFIESIKRDCIVAERNAIIQKTDTPYSFPDYQESTLTTEQVSELKELRDRLRKAPQHYDACVDKENWQFRWVDEYTSGKNTNNYQLKSLTFIKW